MNYGETWQTYANMVLQATKIMKHVYLDLSCSFFSTWPTKILEIQRAHFDDPNSMLRFALVVGQDSPLLSLSLHVFLVEPLIFDLKNEVKPPFLHISTGSTWFYPPSAHPVQRRQATAPGVVWRRRRCAGRGETERHGSSDARPVGWVLWKRLVKGRWIMSNMSQASHAYCMPTEICI